MRQRMIAVPLASILTLVLALGGCGGNSRNETGSAPAPQTEAQSKSAAASPEAETPSEAESAATGDIPDNQVFLTFNNRSAGYSIRYPEGWARRGSAGDVTFQEKGNVIHIVVVKGGGPTPSSAVAELERVRQSDPTVKVGRPERLTIAGAPVIKVTYTRLSTPDPVTGKRLPLTIDRYIYTHGGKVATVDLGTPVGVDNVDAYRLISRSFRWA